MKANKKDWRERSLFPFWELPKNYKLRNRARELRKAGVLSEVIFWKHFKQKELIGGWDIDRQIIIGNYIVDFFIPELGLVFEIDGSSHDDKIEYDAEREAVLSSYGLKIVHIRDCEVKRNLDGVFELVLEEIKNREIELNKIIAGES